MKRKNVSSQPVTKTDLESVLKGLATKEDLKKYATKEDLKIEIKFNTEEILTKVDKNARKYKDEILAKMDEVMGELGVMRDENTIGSGQTSQLRDTAEDHEKRIKNLENLPQSP